MILPTRSPSGLRVTRSGGVEASPPPFGPSAILDATGAHEETHTQVTQNAAPGMDAAFFPLVIARGHGLPVERIRGQRSTASIVTLAPATPR